MLRRGLGSLLRGGALRSSGFCVPKMVVGRSLCTAGDGVDKFPMQHNRALPNHFQDLTTLEAALLEFGAEHGTGNTMPTKALLFIHGRSDLTHAIKRHGGSVAVARRLGLEMAKEQALDQHWNDTEVMSRELLLWIEQHGTPGTMPTQAQLYVSGRGDLASGISEHHSGFKAVTAALGLIPGSNPPSVKPGAYWREWENVMAEMPAVSKACGVAEKMPTAQQLFANGYSSLAVAISKHYGGMHKFAERLDLPMQHSNALPNHYRDFSTLEAALLEFVAEHGTGNTMPTEAQLVINGRSDLAGAMTRYHGGSVAVAGRLGLEMAQDHLPDHYWKDFEMVGRALLLWIDQHGTPGTMPTQAQLCAFGRADLARGIKEYHRGIKAVTAALGLRPGSNPPSVHPAACWLKWENVLAEMPAVGKACGAAGQMPKDHQLRANGYTSLADAISKHYGGMYEFAERF